MEREMKKSGGKSGRMILLLLMMGLFLTGSSLHASAATIKQTLNLKKNTDVSAALQEALNQVRYDTSDAKYEFTIPAGTYKLSQAIKIYSNTTIRMNGVTLVRSGSRKIVMMFFANKDGYPSGKGYSMCKNISLIGGTWDGNGKYGCIFRMAHSQNITIKNVRFTNVKKAHHIELAACKNVRFTNCTFDGHVADDSISTDYEALQIDIMRSEHFANYEEYDETVCRNITIEKCNFRNLELGTGTHSSVVGSYHSNINIRNNTFTDIKGYAIITMNYVDSKVDGNTIKNCGMGIKVRSTGSSGPYKSLKKAGKQKENINLQIRNNTITVTQTGYESPAAGITLNGGSITTGSKLQKGTYRLSGITVQSNNITMNCKGVAVMLRQVDRCVVKDNTIVCSMKKRGSQKDSGAAGVYIFNGSRNRIENNSIKNLVKTGYGSEMSGIIVCDRSNRNVITSNRINNASRYGITIYDDNCKNNRIRGNVIKNCGRADLNVHGTNVVE